MNFDLVSTNLKNKFNGKTNNVSSYDFDVDFYNNGSKNTVNGSIYEKPVFNITPLNPKKNKLN